MFHLDHSTAHIWMGDKYHIPFYAILLYVLHILYLKSVMSNRKSPSFVPKVKFIWDLFLGISSTFGAFSVVPQLVNAIYEHGVINEICTSTIQSTNPFVYYFLLSKFFELFDTTLILAGGKNLIFLHWYHHMATLLYCWDGFVVQNSSGPFFTAMNLCVHAIMYSYYAITFFGRVPSSIRALITLLQLTQMILGTAITLTHLQCQNISDSAYRNGLWALAMYISYFILFGKLFIESYILEKPERIQKEPKKTN